MLTITNAVFTGMGKLSDNASNVLQALDILQDRVCMTADKLTVSTVVPTPGAVGIFAALCVLAWRLNNALCQRFLNFP